MEYVLRAKGITKKYRKSYALDGFDMNIPKGAIYGFVGRNGAGKTTMIRLIAGLQNPSSGEFTLYDRKHDAKDIGKSRRRIGAIVENPSIYLNMTAEENMRQQCIILGLPDYSCIPDILKLVGLENAGKKKAKNFSLGMRQRLGIAIALCGDPDFLILDEPINGLDPEGIIEIRETILKLNKERQVTVLISSHILDELHRLATHYGIIDKGHMVKEMTAEELDAACRKCMAVEVSSIEGLTRVLDKMGVQYKVSNENSAEIYEQINVTKLVNALGEEDCELISVNNHDESFESYFLSLVGGGQDA